MRRFVYTVYILVLLFLLNKMAEANRKSPRAPRKQYSMYVWTDGYDITRTSCDVTDFMEWNSKGDCFTHTWNTADKRAWLWSTCNVVGREISAIYVSDVHHNLRHAYDTGDCTGSDISTVKQMLREGHSQVAGLKIYGLYAVSDIAVSERNLVKYIVHYNDHCTGSHEERFDGVAVNNEAYAGIKCGDIAARTTYLDNLQEIVTEADKQVHGKLLTHYSMSWHWGRCNANSVHFTWNGETKDANHHMIDIFDSTDVQVGYITISAVSDRMKRAGYDYAVSLGKSIYTTLYTNKGDPCQTTFFPNDSCHIHGHSEASMFDLFDAFHLNDIEHAQPCIHYFRGVYSSGGHPDWPVHNDAPSKPIVG